MADNQALEMSLLSPDSFQDLFPVDASPLPVVDDAEPMDTGPQSSPSEAPPLPKAMDTGPQSSPSEAPLQPKARTRTKFDAQAVSHLEVEFGMDQYPTAARRRVMAAKLAIPLIAISNWFHNKRSRLRRQSRMAPKPKSPHPVLMYRQMSRSSVSTDSLSSPDYSPMGAPPLAKRFRTWSVEAAGLPSPQCGTHSPHVDYYSSLGSSSSLDGSYSQSSFSQDASSFQDSSSSLESSFLFSPGVTFPEVFSPAVVHPQPSQGQADPAGALPCEDVFYGQDTPPSPATPGEVFSPTPGGMFSPIPGIAQQVWYGDESYWLGLPPRDRLPAVSTVQDAGLSTLSRPRIDATSQPPTPLPVHMMGQNIYQATDKTTTSTENRQLDFQVPLLGRLSETSNLSSPAGLVPSISTPSVYSSPQTPTWLYSNSPWTPSAHPCYPHGGPGDQLVPAVWTPSLTPESVQDLLALQWLSSPWAWASPNSDNYFQFPEVFPGGSPQFESGPSR